eukprot:gene25355-biopygen2988
MPRATCANRVPHSSGEKRKIPSPGSRVGGRAGRSVLSLDRRRWPPRIHVAPRLQEGCGDSAVVKWSENASAHTATGNTISLPPLYLQTNRVLSAELHVPSAGSCAPSAGIHVRNARHRVPALVPGTGNHVPYPVSQVRDHAPSTANHTSGAPSRGDNLAETNANVL